MPHFGVLLIIKSDNVLCFQRNQLDETTVNGWPCIYIVPLCLTAHQEHFLAIYTLGAKDTLIGLGEPGSKQAALLTPYSLTRQLNYHVSHGMSSQNVPFIIKCSSKCFSSLTFCEILGFLLKLLGPLRVSVMPGCYNKFPTEAFQQHSSRPTK